MAAWSEGGVLVSIGEWSLVVSSSIRSSLPRVRLAHFATGVKANGYREIRRRTDVVGIFPDRTSVIRLVGAVLAEQNDEWTDGRRYLGLDILNSSRLVLITPTDPKQPQEDTKPCGAISA